MKKETRERIMKQKFESKKEDVIKAINSRATYEKWDKYSPIYAYSFIFDKEEEITEPRDRKFYEDFERKYNESILNLLDIF